MPCFGAWLDGVRTRTGSSARTSFLGSGGTCTGAGSLELGYAERTRNATTEANLDTGTAFAMVRPHSEYGHKSVPPDTWGKYGKYVTPHLDRAARTSAQLDHPLEHPVHTAYGVLHRFRTRYRRRAARVCRRLSAGRESRRIRSLRPEFTYLQLPVFSLLSTSR